MHTLTLQPALSHAFARSVSEVRQIHRLARIGNPHRPQGEKWEHLCARADSFGYSCLYRERSLVGAASLWPVSEIWAEALREGRTWLGELDPNLDLVAGWHETPRDWFFADLVVLPELDEPGALLFLARETLFAWFWRLRGHSGRILARGTSPEVEEIWQTLGGRKLREAKGQPDGVPLYEISFTSREDLRQRLRRLVTEGAPLQYALPE